MPLDPPARLGYSFDAPTAVGDRRGNRCGIGAVAPPCDIGAFFTPAFYGGRRWATLGLTGSYSRFSTPSSSAARLVEKAVADSRLNRSLSW
jgi:hypothetical protein